MINGIRYTILGVSDSNVLISYIMATLLTIIFTVSSIFLMQSGKKSNSESFIPVSDNIYL